MDNVLITPYSASEAVLYNMDLFEMIESHLDEDSKKNLRLVNREFYIQSQNLALGPHLLRGIEERTEIQCHSGGDQSLTARQVSWLMRCCPNLRDISIFKHKSIPYGPCFINQTQLQLVSIPNPPGWFINALATKAPNISLLFLSYGRQPLEGLQSDLLGSLAGLFFPETALADESVLPPVFTNKLDYFQSHKNITSAFLNEDRWGNLRELDLGEANLTKAELAAINWQSLKHIKSLNLESLPVSSATLNKIGDTCKDLEKIYVNGCMKIDFSKVNWSLFTKLERLNAWCSSMNDAGLRQLMSTRVPEDVNVAHCCISVDVVQAFRARFPDTTLTASDLRTKLYPNAIQEGDDTSSEGKLVPNRNSDVYYDDGGWCECLKEIYEKLPSASSVAVAGGAVLLIALLAGRPR